MRLEKLKPKEVKAYFEKNNTVIIPTGSIECHGSHNALGVDFLVVEELVRIIDQKSDILIATPIPYGATDGLAGYPGTISLGNALFEQLVMKVTDELYRHGARKFVFLNGHGGNTAPINSVCIQLHKKGGLGAVLNWWTMSWELNSEWKGGHGGAQETSAMLAIDPSLVNMDDIEDECFVNDIEGFETVGFSAVCFEGVNISMPRSIQALTHNGWVGNDHPKNATIQWGEEMLKANADYICRFLEAFRKV